MKKIIGMTAVAGAVALVAAACGSAPAEESGDSGSSASGSASSYKGCMVSDAGGFQDHSFNESGFDGMQAAKKSLGISIATTESKANSDYAPNISALVNKKCNLIVSVGFLLADATSAAADANKSTHFAIVDSSVDPARDNVKPLLFDTAQASFLAGYVAAGVSKTGTVATYGGIKLPSVTIFMDGFADGVAQYDKDSGKSVKLLGWDKAAQDGSFTGDFDDASKGQNTTKNFLDQGADVILPVAGPVGAGTLAAIKAADPDATKDKVIWVDADGYETQADYQKWMLTSVVKQTGNAVQDVLKADSSGSYTADPYVGTLANAGVDLAPYHDLASQVPQDLQDKVADYKKQIIAGTLKITSPSTPDVRQLSSGRTSYRPPAAG